MILSLLNLAVSSFLRYLGGGGVGANVWTRNDARAAGCFSSPFPEYETVTGIGIFGEGNSENRIVLFIVLAVRCVCSERQRLSDIWRRHRCHGTARLRVCFHSKLPCWGYHAADCITCCVSDCYLSNYLVFASRCHHVPLQIQFFWDTTLSLDEAGAVVREMYSSDMQLDESW